jgi:hypothetical protein
MAREIVLPGEPEESGADAVVLLVLAPPEFEQAVSGPARPARARSAGASALPVWVEASAENCCPVCAAPENCAVDAEDPELVLCCCVASAVPAPGGGWVHVVLHRRAVGAGPGSG